MPPVFEITIDTAANIVLGDAYRQILEDADGKWTIDQVSKFPVADKFHYNVTKLNGHDRSANTYWLVYRFKNSMTHDAKIALSRSAISADLYTLDPNGKWDHKITGRDVPWSKLDDLKQISTVTYTIQPGKELLIYERDHFGLFADKPEFPYVDFGFTDKVIKKYFSGIDPSILPSFLFGLLVLGALFNIYFFLIVHKRVYLFFSLMLLGRGLGRFIYDGNIFFPEHPVANGWLVGSLCGLLFS